MPIEDLAGGLFRVIGKIIAYVVVQLILEILLYATGWITLRAFTLGKYPPNRETEHSEGFVQFVGFLLIISIFLTLVIISK